MNKMNTIELVFEVQGDERDMLIAQLGEAGCSAFQETDTALIACVPEDDPKAPEVMAVAARCGIPFSEEHIAAQNWNAAWEASFEPVVVPGFCTVRAPFHAAGGTPYEIVIMPKMSFGTGHHATTYLMMLAMSGMDFRGKRVLDYGTGTGILAILAQQLGASYVLAIDIDTWSIENAHENVSANYAEGVELVQADIAGVHGKEAFDIILANINRNVLLESMSLMRAMLRQRGTLVLSGILEADQTLIFESARSEGFILCESFNERGWMYLKFTA